MALGSVSDDITHLIRQLKTVYFYRSGKVIREHRITAIRMNCSFFGVNAYLVGIISNLLPIYLA